MPEQDAWFHYPQQYAAPVMENLQEEREREQMKRYYSQKAAALQKMVETACDRMDYQGSMMYDEFPDRLMMENICSRIAREYRENEEPDRKDGGEDDLKDWIGVLLYNEMFRRRHRRKKYDPWYCGKKWGYSNRRVTQF